MKRGSGQLGQGRWFSTLLLAAVRQQFTGGICIRNDVGNLAVFFRGGHPVHASGNGFKEHFLGEILIRQSLCSAEQVQAALTDTRGIEDHRSPLLGDILVHDGLDPTLVRNAVHIQLHARLGVMLRVSSGRWMSGPGDDPRIRRVEVPLDPWSTFFGLMQTHACAKELSFQTVALLDTAICLRPDRLPERTWAHEEREILRYLREPRKLNRLELVLGKDRRHRVQGFLRALSLLEALEILPRGRAVPLPQAAPPTTQPPVAGPLNTPPPRVESNPRRETFRLTSKVSDRPLTADRIKRAMATATRAEAHLEMAEFDRAQALFRLAHENDPSSGIYLGSLAWCMYADPKADKANTAHGALSMLEEALKRNARTDGDRLRHEVTLRIFIARILKSTGRVEHALRQFELVLRLEPNHAEARLEVRDSAARSPRGAGPKTGLISSLAQRLGWSETVTPLTDTTSPNPHPQRTDVDL